MFPSREASQISPGFQVVYIQRHNFPQNSRYSWEGAAHIPIFLTMESFMAERYPHTSIFPP